MSDDEMSSKGAGDDEQTGCDAEMEAMMDGYKNCAPAKEFPDGISKDIISKAPSDMWEKPKKGDVVTVHYVGTLGSDASEFDSSRARGKPFEFTLGTGDVIKGWDLGVASMCKGEVARFTISPEFAYGDDGSLPKIPAKATLVFEIELIDWVSKDDLFGDGGVIKTILHEGDGWKTPQFADEVKITLIAVAFDGTTLDERSDLDYTVGSDALASIGRACDKALVGMKRGEKASLTCRKDYADAEKFPDGVTVTISLLEIYEITDVSFAKDKSVMKKLVKKGEGYEKPKEGAKIKLLVEAATDGQEPLFGFTTKTLEFTSMFGEVCDALECTVAGMKKSERAVVTVLQQTDAAEEKLGIGQATLARIVFTLELVDFEKAKDIWDMSKEEKVEFASSRKEVGATLFKKGRTRMALQCYDKVVDVLSGADVKEAAKDMKKACELNKAACLIKLQDFFNAKKSCDSVLKDDPQNIKALYRRAQAEIGLKDFSDCIRDCKRVVDLDAQNKEARSLLRQARLCQKEEDKKSKGFYANMCQALGKLPTPEAVSAKKHHEDDMDDEDEGCVENENTTGKMGEVTGATDGADRDE